MKKLLKTCGVVALFGAILFAGFAGNYPSTMRLPPDEAAIVVARKYSSVKEGAYAARPSEKQSAGSSIAYVVLRDGRECARVRLEGFMAIGWQEEAYEALN